MCERQENEKGTRRTDLSTLEGSLEKAKCESKASMGRLRDEELL